MLVTELGSRESEVIKPLQGPGILIVTGGFESRRKEHEVKEGYVFFIGYNTRLELKAESGLETHLASAEL